MSTVYSSQEKEATKIVYPILIRRSYTAVSTGLLIMEILFFVVFLLSLGVAYALYFLSQSLLFSFTFFVAFNGFFQLLNIYFILTSIRNWMKISYEIYQNKIVLKNGDKEENIMLHTIHVSVRQNVLGKFLNYGTLVIKPLIAKPAYLYMISHPQKYQKIILELASPS